MRCETGLPGYPIAAELDAVADGATPTAQSMSVPAPPLPATHRTSRNGARHHLTRAPLQHRGRSRSTEFLNGRRRGVRAVLLDSGPGIADIDLALTNGWTSGSGLGLGLSGSRRSADHAEIGGDFFDAFDTPAGDAVIVIDDVQGHSLSAAVIMAEPRCSLRAYAYAYAYAYAGRRPQAVVERLNRLMLAHHPDSTAPVCIIVLPADRSRARSSTPAISHRF